MKQFVFFFLLLAAPVFAQDGIDLTQAVYHGSPNISGWPITVDLQGIEFKPGRASDGNTVGIRPIFDRAKMNQRWPDVKPVGWEGSIQYTLWACVKPTVIWHCAGLHEFWSDRNGAPRIWSGAPITTQWNDWVYRNQWGPEMETYTPRLGDEIVFGLTSGDRRLMDLGDVRERTQFLRFPVVDVGTPPALSAVTPPVVVPPVVPPVNTSPAPVDLSEIHRQISDIRALVDSFAASLSAVSATVDSHGRLIDTQRDRLEALEARPVPPTTCYASLFGLGVRCELR